LVAAAFITDPQLGIEPTSSPNGEFQVLQLVGLTEDEYDAVKRWDTSKFLSVLARRDAAMLTDLPRRSWLQTAEIAMEVNAATARDGSSMSCFFGVKGGLGFERETPVWGLPANGVADLSILVRGRLDHGRGCSFMAEGRMLHLLPGDTTVVTPGEVPTLTLSAEDREFLLTLPAARGDYCTPSGRLVVRVLPVEIFDGTRTKVLQVIG
jgi:suppressor of fused